MDGGDGQERGEEGDELVHYFRARTAAERGGEEGGQGGEYRKGDQEREERAAEAPCSDVVRIKDVITDSFF